MRVKNEKPGFYKKPGFWLIWFGANLRPCRALTLPLGLCDLAAMGQGSQTTTSDHWRDREGRPYGNSRSTSGKKISEPLVKNSPLLPLTVTFPALSIACTK